MARNVRYQIFVSSTYTDLIPVRRQVTEQILSMNHIPAGMEMFSASGRQQWATIQKAIDNSDYYVLIIGERYGSISPEDGISYTEKEFNYALSKNIPTLCFLPGRNYSTPREHRETDQALIEKLEFFKGRLKEQLCDFWESGEELVSKVSTALYKIFTEEPGTGWIRGDAADPDVLTKLVNIMEENQQLSSRIRQIEEENGSSLPLLSLKINNHDFNSGPLLYALADPTDPVIFTPDLRREDIPSYLNSLITDESILEFNSSKPSEADIIVHNDNLRFYQAARTGELSFAIQNTGSVKANNVLINIDLPEGIRMMKKDELDELEEPMLHIPRNPVDLANFKNQAQLESRSRTPLTPWSSRTQINIARPIPAQLMGSPPDLHVRKDGVIKGSLESVRQDSTHTLRSTISLVPTKRGQFTLDVSILCDELPRWQRSTIDIIVQ